MSPDFPERKLARKLVPHFANSGASMSECKLI